MWCVYVCIFKHMYGVCVYIYVCSVHVQAHECVVYMCVFKHMCVYIHVRLRLTLGLFPVHSSPYIMETGSLAVRMTNQLTPGILSPFPTCWVHRQASPPLQFSHGFWRLEHGSSHTSKHLTLQASPQGYVLFCMVLGLCCAVSPNTWFFP